MILAQMQERRDRVESDLRKETENLTVRLDNLKQGHNAESEMYRWDYPRQHCRLSICIHFY